MPKFETNEDYWRWFEEQDRKRFLEEYFGKEVEEDG